MKLSVTNNVPSPAAARRAVPAYPVADREEIRRIRQTTVPVRGEGDIGDEQDQDQDENAPPIPGWKPAEGLLLIIADRQAFLVPAAGLAWVPSEAQQRLSERAIPHLTEDLGSFFEVPATGASGSRVFRAGRNTAMMIDAGSNPMSGVPTAVYLNQLQGVMSTLGLTRVGKLPIIHIHSDHVSEVPSVVARYNVPAQGLVIPAPYVGVNQEIRAVVRELQSTTDPALLAAGYGAGWAPGTRLKDKGGPTGDVFLNSYTYGDLRVEHVALRSALRAAETNPARADMDLASYFTKVTRTTDRASTVLMGDLRGADLMQIRNAMEARQPGSWNQFFAGETTLSGFSHHLGRMETSDVPGMMALLDATLLRNGRLRVVEQTHTGEHPAARRDTIELARRLGIELVYSDMPSAASGPSAAGATRSTVYARGPQSAAPAPIASNLTTGLSRLSRLIELRATLERWQPHTEKLGLTSEVREITPELENSIESLRGALRTATEAALRVRTGSQRTATGTRDYTTTGGGRRSRSTAFQNALAAIPATTTAETALANPRFNFVEELHQASQKDIPLQVALHRAIAYGEYSEQAFRHMLSSLDPSTRNSLLVDPREGPSAKLTTFKRVRAHFHFRSTVLAGTGEVGMPRRFSAGGKVAARGAAGGMAFLELWNAAVVPLMGAVQTDKQVYSTQNFLPFLRRLMFWNQAQVTPQVTGIEDPTFGSLVEENNYMTVIEGLRKSRWDALLIRGISDADVLLFGAWLSYNIRNLDEFETFFQDSGQDAVTWEMPAGKKDWTKAVWKVRVGRFETSDRNHVVESWAEHPKLTELMQAYTARLIANTEKLLAEEAAGRPVSASLENSLGRLEGFEGKHLYRARLKEPAAATDVEVEALGQLGGARLPRKADWWSPPVFWVLRVEGDKAEITGADYNTYTLLRGLENERRDPILSQHASSTTTPTGNLYGRVWIPLSRIERLQ